MNTIRSFTLSKILVLALLATSLNAARASAQAMQGKFTLPFETRWALATLPAGTYSFTLSKVGAGGNMEIYRGARAVALIQNQRFDYNPSARSALTVTRNRAGNTVRAMSLPQIGVVLYFASHNPKHRTASDERETAQLIPVTPVGKRR